MSRVLLVLPILALLGGVAHAASNPMQPPRYALQKYHEERLRSLPPGMQPKKAVVKPLVLNSILYSAKRKIAIVNEQMYTVGEKVEGAKILAIYPDRVKLVRKGKVIQLSLQAEENTVQVTTKKRSL